MKTISGRVSDEMAGYLKKAQDALLDETGKKPSIGSILQEWYEFLKKEDKLKEV